MSLKDSQFTTVLKSLLRPIIRLCLRHTFKVADVEEILKQLFVEEAKADLLRSGSPESISKLSVMTGLQRPAITARLSQAEVSSPVSSNTSLLVKVIGAWQTKRSFTTKAGKPRQLTVEGKESEFAALVHSVSQALNPYTVLFELERASAVARKNGKVELLQSALIAKKDTTQGFSFLALDVQDLFSAVEQNLFERPAQPNHHVTTEFDSIPKSDEPKIRSLLLREGHRLHKKLRQLIGQFDTDTNNKTSSEEKVRVAFSSFSSIRAVSPLQPAVSSQTVKPKTDNEKEYI